MHGTNSLLKKVALYQIAKRFEAYDEQTFCAESCVNRSTEADTVQSKLKFANLGD